MVNLNNYPHIKVIHIIKDNKVIFEQSREDLSDSKLFPVACIFKSFLSVLVGIAIYEGKINSIEDYVLDYFPHKEPNDVNWNKVKIKHALSKTTGIIWPGPRDVIPINMYEVTKLKFEGEPGNSFKYKPDPQIVVYLLEQVYGMEITKLFETKILTHFENTNYQWNRENIEGMQVSIQLLDELSKDFRYEKGNYVYHDTYLGGEQFVGQEAIWKNGKAMYAMNYFGRVIGENFSGDFLKEALRAATYDCPYRGPIFYQSGEYTYATKVTGDIHWFQGVEEIYHNIIRAD